MQDVEEKPGATGAPQEGGEQPAGGALDVLAGMVGAYLMNQRIAGLVQAVRPYMLAGWTAITIYIGYNLGGGGGS